tara:strand:+ start:791 stop:1411 length:621 start_codon:yes stop_codon:yes gene_type:complete
MTYNKAAMFGLDARIALAIFGALSVISGAALYSAIKTAKTEQLRQNFVEIIKASEQYYLDNFSPLKNYAANVFIYSADLVNNRESLSTWNGPYLQGTAQGSASFKNQYTKSIHANTYFTIFLRQSDTWTEMNDTISDEMCTVGDSNCSEWISLVANEASISSTVLNIFNDLDDLVDNGDGALEGTVRFNTKNSGYIMYKGINNIRE